MSHDLVVGLSDPSRRQLSGSLRTLACAEDRWPMTMEISQRLRLVYHDVAELSLTSSKRWFERLSDSTMAINIEQYRVHIVLWKRTPQPPLISFRMSISVLE